MSKKVFISGSMGIKRLNAEAMLRIRKCVDEKEEIFIGDAKGVDEKVQRFLFNKEYYNAKVFFVGNAPRTYLCNMFVKMRVENMIEYSPKNRRAYYAQKDIIMSEMCDYAIAIWDGKSVGTKNNIDRLEKLGKKVEIVRV